MVCIIPGVFSVLHHRRALSSSSEAATGMEAAAASNAKPTTGKSGGPALTIGRSIKQLTLLLKFANIGFADNTIS